MKIVFNHPPTGTRDRFNDFDPKNPNHYPEDPGIYINGLKKIINGKLIFIPLYVGITTATLRKRLYNDHYNLYKSGGAGKKDLWSVSAIKSLMDVYNLYSEMYFYDNINNYRSGNRTTAGYLNILVNLKYLIFFQNHNYFLLKSGKKYKSLNQKQRELSHIDAIETYKNCSSNITTNKNLFTQNFYFVFASFKDIEKQILQDEQNKSLLANYQTPKAILERIERSTKRALNLIGIHTTAKADGEIIDMEIDLANIQNELINLGGHSYNASGVYKQSLNIFVRK